MKFVKIAQFIDVLPASATLPVMNSSFPSYTGSPGVVNLHANPDGWPRVSRFFANPWVQTATAVMVGSVLSSFILSCMKGIFLLAVGCGLGFALWVFLQKPSSWEELKTRLAQKWGNLFPTVEATQHTVEVG
jgi:hypothetical protein